jgi:hypothetical protein
MISWRDATEIFETPSTALDALSSVQVDGEPYYDEVVLQQAWTRGQIPSPHKPRIGGATISLDELILRRLIELTFDDATVIPQVRFGRRRVDIDITVSGKHVLVEFFGPAHFIPQYATPKEGPLERKLRVEEHFGAECVIWPYWIQRCQLNVLALFSRSVEGLASVWSTKALFGQFVASDAADLVESLSGRFRAISAEGIGYMYTDERVSKPIHPIVASIQAGRVSVDQLIPRGTTRSHRFWVPKQLWGFIKPDS